MWIDISSVQVTYLHLFNSNELYSERSIGSIYSTSTSFTYPKLANQNKITVAHQLPGENEINNVIAQCKQDAINMTIKFNLISSTSPGAMKQKATSCQVKPYTPKITKQKTKHSHRLANSNTWIIRFQKYCFKELYRKKNPYVKRTSPYLEFHFNTRRIVVKKKTSFCWLLRNDVTKMSNDRLMKVQTRTDSNRINNKPKSKQINKKMSV